MKLHVIHLGGTCEYNRGRNSRGWTIRFPGGYTAKYTNDQVNNISEREFLDTLRDNGVDISGAIILEDKKRNSPPSKYTTRGRGRPRKGSEPRGEITRKISVNVETNENVTIPNDVNILSV